MPGEAPSQGTLSWELGQRVHSPCPTGTLTSSARTGRKMIMVAVLLANSVKKAMTTVMSRTASTGGTCSRGCSCPPIHADSPDSCGQTCLQSRSNQYHPSQTATSVNSSATCSTGRSPGDPRIHSARKQIPFGFSAQSYSLNGRGNQIDLYG